MRAYLPPPPRHCSLRVFLVEDAPRVRALLREQLNELPSVAVVGVAESENIAVAAVPRLDCDVVIVDIRLREGSGLSVLRRLDEARRAPREATFIVFSNCAEEGYRRLAAHCGADHFFDKAGGPRPLLDTVRSLAAARDELDSMACALQSGLHGPFKPGSPVMNSTTTQNTDALAKAERMSSTAHETIDKVVDSAHPAVDRLAEKAHDAVQRAASAASAASENVSAHSAQLRDLKDTFADDCRAYVQANPMKALAYAAVAGFVLTRLLRD